MIELLHQIQIIITVKGNSNQHNSDCLLSPFLKVYTLHISIYGIQQGTKFFQQYLKHLTVKFA